MGSSNCLGIGQRRKVLRKRDKGDIPCTRAAHSSYFVNCWLISFLAGFLFGLRRKGKENGENRVAIVFGRSAIRTVASPSVGGCLSDASLSIGELHVAVLENLSFSTADTDIFHLANVL